MTQISCNLYRISQKSPSSGYYGNSQVIMSTPSAHSGLINGSLHGLSCHQSLMPCIDYGIFQCHELVLQMSRVVVANYEINDSSAFIPVLHPWMFLSHRHQQSRGCSHRVPDGSSHPLQITISLLSKNAMFRIFRQVGKNSERPTDPALGNAFITEVPKMKITAN